MVLKAAVCVLALGAQIGTPVHDAPPVQDATPVAPQRPLPDVPLPGDDVSSPPDLARDVESGSDPGAEGRAGSSGFPAAGSSPVIVPEGRAVRSGMLVDRLTSEDWLWVARVAAGLTLEEKVAQLVVAYLEGGLPSPGSARWERAVRLVEEERVGGFIVGAGPGYESAVWLNELQARSSLPLLMAADLEWGPGTRLKGGTLLPINMAVAASGPSEVAYEAGRITAREARAAGVHMAFAPVADVNVNPANPVINTRSYGSDPERVSERVAAFVAGARSGGLLTVVKHFPGHGDTETDSHLAMPVLDVDRLRLEKVELRPFRAAIGAGVDGVMSAHLAVPVLDPSHAARPATLSAPIMTDLLRTRLGFGGLVVTDALHMDGVKRSGSPGRVAVAALAAGADILLMPPDEADVIAAVVRAVRRGELSEERIDRSLHRVLAAKAAVGLREGRHTDLVRAREELGRSEHSDWSRRVAERSMTLVRLDPRSLPATLRGRSVVAVLYDDRRGHDAGETFVAALTERGARVEAVRLSKRSRRSELMRARRLAAEADYAVLASFTRAVPWKGELGLPEDVARLARELSAAGAPIVSFGDPYLIRQLPDVGTYLLAWSREDVSQQAAARALLGEIPVRGRLPIDLPPDHRVGDGIRVPGYPDPSRLPVTRSSQPAPTAGQRPQR